MMRMSSSSSRVVYVRRRSSSSPPSVRPSVACSSVVRMTGGPIVIGNLWNLPFFESILRSFSHDRNSHFGI